MLERDVQECKKNVDYLPGRKETTLEHVFPPQPGKNSTYEQDKTMVELFAGKVKELPDHIALVYGEGGHMTYKELDKRSTFLANALVNFGVINGDAVGIMAKRSAEMIIGILGILKTGAAYLPLNPQNPLERIGFMLADTQARLLLTGGEKIPLTRDLGLDIAIIDIETHSRSCPERETGPGKNCFKKREKREKRNVMLDDYAYIIYTSGSTGRPKGVPITHRNLSPLLHWGYQHLRIGAKDRVIQQLSFFFDWSVWEIFITLTSGAQLYMISDEVLLNPREQAAFISKKSITVLHLTPTQLHYLVDTGKELPGLHYLFIGAEKLTVDLARSGFRLVGDKGHCRLFNMYGPTETTIIASVLEIDREKLETYRILSSVPIGSPVGNTDLWILDSDFKRCPVEIPGELYISGQGVAHGYLNNPGLTQEKFVALSPLLSLYKTGDLARWLKDGTIEFLGRVDHQVKIRGFRMELGEIENGLREVEGVEEAVVTVGPGPQAGEEVEKERDKYLCAYYVAKKDAMVTDMMLRDHLESKLPGYMIPAYFIRLEYLPLNANGKLDRGQLPAAGIHLKKNNTMEEQPRTPIEHELIKIWQEILEVNPVSIDDHFFRLGGHSLLAGNLSALITRHLNVELPISEIFKNPTIASQADFISQIISCKGKSEFVEIPLAEEQEYYPMSSAQKRIYIMSILKGRETHYNISITLAITGKLEWETAGKIFWGIIEHQESFRTSFHLVNGQPVQKIHEISDVDFKVERVGTSASLEKKENGVELDIDIRDFVRPFVLSTPGQCRVGIFEGEAGQQYLLLDIHHIIADKVSIDNILTEFSMLYEGQTLSPLRVRYRDFTMWHEKLKQDMPVSRTQFWLNRLSGEIPVLNLPLDFPRPTILGFAGEVVHFAIESERAEALQALALAKNATVYMVLLAIYHFILSKWSGQEDIMIGTPVAGRIHDDLAPIMGMFVNTLVMRNFIDKAKTFGDFLINVRNHALEAFENQDFPFEDLVNRLTIARDPGRNPLFDVAFTYNKMERTGRDNQARGEGKPVIGFEYADSLLEHDTSKFDMTLGINEIGKGEPLKGTVEYCTGLFKRGTINRFISHFLLATARILKDPDQLLKDIDILDEQERQELIIDFNAGQGDYSNKKTLDSLFEIQVEKQPDHIALVGGVKDKKGGETSCYLTYKKLDEVSTGLSVIIKEQGVERGDVVGILTLRSLAMIIGILGILKSGAAYLPLNPQNPWERNRFMLADTGTRLLLTEPGTIHLTAAIEPGIRVIDISKNIKAATSRRGEVLGTAGKNDVDGVKRERDKDTNPHSYAYHSFAYIIYTSGSTGQPKGVPITHANLSPLLHWGYDVLGLSCQDRAIQELSYFFDWSVWEIFITLTSGASLYMISDELVLNAKAQSQYILKHALTVLHLTPTQLHHLLEGGMELPTLKYLFIGAEKLSRELVQEGIRATREECRIFNMYGPTEATIISAVQEITRSSLERYESLTSIPIGRQAGNNSLLVLDAFLQPSPIQVAGELYIFGDGVAAGYINNPGLSKEKFLPLSTPGISSHWETLKDLNKNFSGGEGGRFYKKAPLIPLLHCFYKTGDRVRWLVDGTIEFLGRVDFQVKIRGYRLELGEIEKHMLGIAGIREAIVIAVNGTQLSAYYVSDEAKKVSDIRYHLEKKLPPYMIPSYFTWLETLPLNANGKVDRGLLPEHSIERDTGVDYMAPTNNLEWELLTIWQEALGIEKIGMNDNMFALGGNSFTLLKIQDKIDWIYPGLVKAVDIFTYPTIATLAEYIREQKQPGVSTGGLAGEAVAGVSKPGMPGGKEIAIIGMGIKLKDTEERDEFWKYLAGGVDGIEEFPLRRRETIERLIGKPDKGYEVSGYMDEVEFFDYGFFKLSPREARLMDPNQRLFLQAAWRALEDGGYGGGKLTGTNTGVFVGFSSEENSYKRLVKEYAREDLPLALAGNIQSIIASRVSYLLDFHGPALVVDTACSSGLVALHTACRSIRSGECSQALVGSVKIKLLPVVHDDDVSEIMAKDGRTRTFDDSSTGTGTGEGVIVVLVKSLEEAQTHGDNILAVIKGSAVNQDGSSIGITAPSAKAQADVIDQAWQDAGIDAQTIGYIEAHGTGTRLGDPIEIEGITRAFRRYTDKKQFCAVGSIKTNVGHLDHAAGLAGLLKAILVLNHQAIPPLVHFQRPNRQIDFVNSPVFVNRELLEWKNSNNNVKTNIYPRRCGISSFGMSGTNCHVVLEEALVQEIVFSERIQVPQIFTLSARTPWSFKQLVQRYIVFLEKKEALELDHLSIKGGENQVNRDKQTLYNLCYTANTGRGHYQLRLAVLTESLKDLKSKLAKLSNLDWEKQWWIEEKDIYFGRFRMVPLNKTTREKYEFTESEIAEKNQEVQSIINQLSEGIQVSILQDIAKRYTSGAGVDWNAFHGKLNIKTRRIPLPVYPFERHFCWLEGNYPNEKTRTGQIGKNETPLLERLNAEIPGQKIYETFFNTTSHWVVGEHRVNGVPTLVGTAYLELLVEVWHAEEKNRGVEIHNLTIVSPLVIEKGETKSVKTIVQVEPGRLGVRLVSRAENMEGTKQPGWFQHIDATLFPVSDHGVERVDIEKLLEEFGHGEMIDAWPGGVNENHSPNGLIEVSDRWECLKKVFIAPNRQRFLGYLEVGERFIHDLESFYLHPALWDGALHFAVEHLGLEAAYLPLGVKRVKILDKTGGAIYSLVEVKNQVINKQVETLQMDIWLLSSSGRVLAVLENYSLKRVRPATQPAKLDRFFHNIRWVKVNQEQRIMALGEKKKNILVIHNGKKGEERLVNALNTKGDRVIEVTFTKNLEKGLPLSLDVNGSMEDFSRVLKEMGDSLFERVIYRFHGRASGGLRVESPGELKEALRCGVTGLFNFTRALVNQETGGMELFVIITGAALVKGTEKEIDPESAALVGITKVIPQENPHIRCRCIDWDESTDLDILLKEMDGPSEDLVVAYRDNNRYAEEYYKTLIDDKEIDIIKENKVYVVSGGLGGIGFELSQYMARDQQIKLALLNRSPFPSRQEWINILGEGQDENVVNKIIGIQKIEKNGSEVVGYTVDVTDYQELARVLEQIRRELGEIKGVIHSAGVAGQGFIINKEETMFNEVLAPKIAGTWNLDQLTRNDHLDFFVMCSSLAVLTGSPGQSDYTAANYYEDAYAYHRHLYGLKTLAIDWPAWKEVGMAKNFGVNQDGLFKTILNIDGSAAFARVLAQSEPRVMVGEPDLDMMTSVDLGINVRIDIKLKEKTRKTNQQAIEQQGPARITKENIPVIELTGRPNQDYTLEEQLVAAAWSEVLGFDGVDIFANYYDLGGDSINALRIVNTINKSLGLNLTVVDIFTHLTVRDLAAYITEKRRSLENSERGKYTGIQPVKDRAYYPLSAAQKRLFLLDRMSPGHTGFNLPLIRMIEGELDIPRLESALAVLVKRHETLRTSFTLVNDEPAQVIHPDDKIHLKIKPGDINRSNQKNHDPGDIHYLSEPVLKFVRPFDLARAPLIRVELLQLEKNKFLLMMDLHHIIADAMGCDIFLHELINAYTGESLPELPIQYRDFAIWQKDTFISGTIESQKAYWLNRFKEPVTPLSLPTDFPRPAYQSFAGDVYTAQLDQEKTTRARKFAQAHESTLYMVTLAAFFTLLHRYSGQEDIVIGSATSGRTHPDLEKLVGMFVNILAIRSFPQPGKTFLQFLDEVKTSSLEAVENQDYPFDQLVDELDLERDLSRTPLSDIAFSYMSFTDTTIADKPLAMDNVRLLPFAGRLKESTKGDMTLFCTETDDIIFSYEYCTALFNAQRMGQFSRHFITVIEWVMAHENQPLGELDLLDENEKYQLLKELNQTDHDLPLNQTMTSRFEHVARQNPGHVALYGSTCREYNETNNEINEVTMTYGFLDQQSNALARVLSREKNGEKNIMGVLLYPSLEMIVAILAILKTGAAYLPIDPAYPSERLEYMLADSHCQTLITEPKTRHLLKSTGPNLNIIDINQIDKPTIEKRGNPGTQVAYIIYTSGSTGKPKGVIIEHASLLNLCAWHTETFDITARDRATRYAGVGFDASVWETFPYLYAGASLYIVGEPIKLDMEGLHRYFERHCITATFLPTQVAETFMQEENQGLRLLFTGGDKLREFKPRRYRIINNYGPTENTVVSTSFSLSRSMDNIPIGKPVYNTQIILLDPQGRLQPIGVPGELCIMGQGLARGYLNQPELTVEKFILRENQRVYRSGDLARWNWDGDLEFLGRIDRQVKIRGFRIELGEIELALLEYPGISETVVLAVSDSADGYEDMYLHAFYVGVNEPETGELKTFLGGTLPAYMVPAVFSKLEKLPLTANGKIDRQTLEKQGKEKNRECEVTVIQENSIEQLIANTWKEILRKDKIGLAENFFDLGGNSLLIIKLATRLKSLFKQDIPVMALFRFPTVGGLAKHLEKELGVSAELFKKESVDTPVERKIPRQQEIAIIGMAGRFPGANSVSEFWFNLENRVESVTFFSDQELLENGVEPGLLENPQYVKAAAIIEGMDEFDAAFFGYTPIEARLMDPQVRIFHECVQQALEDAGYFPGRVPISIGLYAGASSSSYWEQLVMQSGLIDRVGLFAAINLINRDFMCSRISYNLDLDGPSFTLQTACSTSLVAVHQACLGLRAGECHIALAGGVSALGFVAHGYLYQEGMIHSRDGHCRAFDERSTGTVFGCGAGVVVLKSFERAREDRDHIYAIIKGSAVNNDGSGKVGYTAPGIEGQASVIRKAHEAAGISADTITYVETHGTGTILGDPVEIEALKLAFNTDKKEFCGIGSVKTNIGHLDAAAGIAGFIKTVLALYHCVLPPSLNFETPNPRIDFANSPFYVNTGKKEWRVKDMARRAGVSSFGIGGTNAHVILEEAPIELEAGKPGRDYHLLVLSAKTPTALEKIINHLADYLRIHPDIHIGDVAFTLAMGRGYYPHRQIVVCKELNEAINELEKVAKMTDEENPGRWEAEFNQPPVVFMFPGQGAQYIDMGRELYMKEKIFREAMEQCFALLEPLMTVSVKEILYPGPGKSQTELGKNQELLGETWITQPVIFVFEYALARLLIQWGYTPRAMIGHSIGEYVAAHLAGVMSLQDALTLVVKRGQLMQKVARGSMLSVPLGEEDCLSQLLHHPHVSLAAVNSTGRCVVSGPVEDIEILRKKLVESGLDSRVLHTSHAFHSAMMDPVLEEFKKTVAHVSLNKPSLSYISNVTGRFIKAGEAQDPGYWVSHLRGTVRFADGIKELLKLENPVFLEVGPGNSLTTFTKNHCDCQTGQRRFILNMVRHPQEAGPDVHYLLTQVGKLWLYGASPNWNEYFREEKPGRVSLPTYPFEPKRFQLDIAATITSLLKVEKPFKLEEPAASNASTLKNIEETENRGTPTRPNPVNDTEKRLMEIWKHFFGVDTVKPRDNFFELGGDSLLAIRIISAINDEFGIKLLSQVLLKHPTIKAIAKLVNEKAQSNQPKEKPGEEPTPVNLAMSQPRLVYEPLVPIQTGEPGKRSIFIIHPIGGHVYFYRDLGASLGQNQPLYGLQAQGLDDDSQPCESIPGMAVNYLEAIRGQQPHGPYIIGGSSFGGMVAFEIACLLQKEGEETALLFMIDTPGPGHMPLQFKDDAEILAYYLNGNKPAKKNKMVITGEIIREMNDDQLRELLLEYGGPDNTQDPGTVLKQTRRLLKVFNANFLAMFNYQPQPYHGKLLFFRATLPSPQNAVNPEKAWMNMAKGGFSLFDVPGDHISMNILPHVQVIGDILKKMI